MTERIFPEIKVIWHFLDPYLVDLDLSSKLMLRIALSDELPPYYSARVGIVSGTRSLALPLVSLKTRLPL
jgi:hypothetical protein